MSKPTLNRKRDYHPIYNGAPSAPDDPLKDVRFMQDGQYFRADGSYHSDVAGKKRPEVVAPVPAHEVNTKPAVDESEVEELLKDPKAEHLLDLPRDLLVAMVTEAGGPMISGDGSSKLMVAWLIKNTRSAGAPIAPKSKPAPLVPPVTHTDPSADDQL